MSTLPEQLEASQENNIDFPPCHVGWYTRHRKINKDIVLSSWATPQLKHFWQSKKSVNIGKFFPELSWSKAWQKREKIWKTIGNFCWNNAIIIDSLDKIIKIKKRCKNNCMSVYYKNSMYNFLSLWKPLFFNRSKYGHLEHCFMDQ